MRANRLGPTLVVACVSWLSACRGGKAVDYTTHKVARQTIVQAVTAVGAVAARHRVDVGSQISGMVTRVLVDFGAQVKKGDVLAVLDARLLTAQRARAEAAVAVARAECTRTDVSLEAAERTLQRHEQLAHRTLVATAELDEVRLQRELARAAQLRATAAVAQARADAEVATANLALTHIRSPIDGIIVDRQVQPGQTVAAQFQVATLFAIVADLRQVIVLLSVDEADVGQVRVGMPVSFHVDAHPGQTFHGQLTCLRPAPSQPAATGSASAAASSAATAVVSYTAVVEVDNARGDLMQGMTAQATLIVAERHQVPATLLAALRYGGPPGPHPEPAGAASDEPEQVRQIWVLSGGTPQARRITLGRDDGRYVEVLQGLAPGDDVIVAHAAPEPSRRRGFF